jgi:hypothetical protein
VRHRRRALLDDLAAMNAEHLADYGDPEIDSADHAHTKWRSACRPACRTWSIFRKRSAATIKRYGPDALNKGIVCQQLFDRPATAGTRRAICATDALPAGISTATCSRNSNSSAPTRDAPSAALVQDLKERGLLDDTLIDLGRRVRPHTVRARRSGEIPRVAITSAKRIAGGSRAAV